jgi:hypothetical protein
MENKIKKIVDNKYNAYKEYSDYYKEFESKLVEDRKDILSNLIKKDGNVDVSEYLDVAYDDILYKTLHRLDINNLALNYVNVVDVALFAGVELEKKYIDLYELLKPKLTTRYFIIKNGKAEAKRPDELKQQKDTIKTELLEMWKKNLVDSE